VKFSLHCIVISSVLEIVIVVSGLLKVKWCALSTFSMRMSQVSNISSVILIALLVVFGQVGFTAHGLKSRLVFARAVCWLQTHLPQAWIGCCTGLLNLARLVWRNATQIVCAKFRENCTRTV